MTVDEYEIWVKIFCIYYKKIDTPESLIVLFSSEKLALLSLLEEVKRSLGTRKMIKLLIWNLFPPRQHSCENLL